MTAEKKRQPLHPCLDCGCPIGARKHRCGPCASERLRKQQIINLRRRRERQKAVNE